jgi:hypothetical protein
VAIIIVLILTYGSPSPPSSQGKGQIVFQDTDHQLPFCGFMALFTQKEDNTGKKAIILNTVF